MAWSPDERHMAGLRYAVFDETGAYRDDSFSGQDLADVRLSTRSPR